MKYATTIFAVVASGLFTLGSSVEVMANEDSDRSPPHARDGQGIEPDDSQSVLIRADQVIH